MLVFLENVCKVAGWLKYLFCSLLVNPIWYGGGGRIGLPLS